jgi:spermidine/putrescine transport system ATP-binding protein
VEIADVSRCFGDYIALNHVSLTIARGEFFSLLGPSGCGKTTLLRIIAGLDLADSGTVRLGGRDVTNTPAHQRPVNTVFQSYALFPHLTVRDNVAFGLRMKRTPDADVNRRVEAAMELTQITAFAERRPAQISGGQRQRVALARALVNEPEVLLLDEPLGALDLKLRRQLQAELHALQRRLGITFIFVTHDQEEALALSDRIAVMNAGRIEQLGHARDLYERPRNRFVAQFLGTCNLLPGTVREVRGDALVVTTHLGELTAEREHDTRTFSVGEKCTLAIRPEKVSLREPRGELRPGEHEARILSVVYNGSDTELSLEAVGLTLHVCCMNADARTINRKPGQRVIVTPPSPDSLIILED